MLSDNQLHGRAYCGAGIFRSSVSGTVCWGHAFFFFCSLGITIASMFSHFAFLISSDVLFQAKCLETGETVAIKKVLQDKRYKNRELQTMRLLDHPNVVSLKHCFFSTTEKDELFLNLVLEYVPETVHRVIRHYNKMSQRMPMIYVKLYAYQVYSVPHAYCKKFVYMPVHWAQKFKWFWLFLISWSLSQLNCLFLADFQSTSVHPWQCWSVPQGHKTTKFIGNHFFPLSIQYILYQSNKQLTYSRIVCRLIHTPIRWSYVILEVQKYWWATLFTTSNPRYLQLSNFVLSLIILVAQMCRSKENQIFHTYVQGTIVLRNSYSVRQNTLLPLTSGLLDVLWLNYCLDRLVNELLFPSTLFSIEFLIC